MLRLATTNSRGCDRGIDTVGTFVSDNCAYVCATSGNRGEKKKSEEIEKVYEIFAGEDKL